jgi:hypothetical protein
VFYANIKTTKTAIKTRPKCSTIAARRLLGLGFFWQSFIQGLHPLNNTSTKYKVYMNIALSVNVQYVLKERKNKNSQKTNGIFLSYFCLIFF